MNDKVSEKLSKSPALDDGTLDSVVGGCDSTIGRVPTNPPITGSPGPIDSPGGGGGGPKEPGAPHQPTGTPFPLPK